MSNAKPLYKTDLVDAIKEAGVVTKDDLRKTTGTLETQLKKYVRKSNVGLENRLKKHITKEITDSNRSIIAGAEGMFKERDGRFDKLEAGQRELKRQVSDLKFDAPTQKELDELKEKVERHHPTH